MKMILVIHIQIENHQNSEIRFFVSDHQRINLIHILTSSAFVMTNIPTRACHERKENGSSDLRQFCNMKR